MNVPDGIAWKIIETHKTPYHNKVSNIGGLYLENTNSKTTFQKTGPPDSGFTHGYRYYTHEEGVGVGVECPYSELCSVSVDTYMRSINSQSLKNVFATTALK